ncbi:hypothetical protein ARMGADRAFT_1031476 [Armillaria gallica]|uniref:Uncharacterized protein n=1 Tax=Armillaria gallica TaxID=47427 RepID=A0A2H3DMD6_ARMGA|nr:hypothetical protein ARMGADRAFT_1031476 [Armillaria gallica]
MSEGCQTVETKMLTYDCFVVSGTPQDKESYRAKGTSYSLTVLATFESSIWERRQETIQSFQEVKRWQASDGIGRNYQIRRACEGYRCQTMGEILELLRGEVIYKSIGRAPPCLTITHHWPEDLPNPSHQRSPFFPRILSIARWHHHSMSEPELQVFVVFPGMLPEDEYKCRRAKVSWKLGENFGDKIVGRRETGPFVLLYTLLFAHKMYPLRLTATVLHTKLYLDCRPLFGVRFPLSQNSSGLEKDEALRKTERR